MKTGERNELINAKKTMKTKKCKDTETEYKTQVNIEKNTVDVM